MTKQDFDNKLYFYSGAIHIHSDFSDGTGDIFEISRAAKKAGLFWIIVTDHNSMEIKEGIYNGVYVIKGEEISPEHENHYIALDIDQTILPSANPADYVEKVRSHGGFGFAAHPDEAENRKNKAKPIRWPDKSVEVDGIEIWNWFSDWADNYDETNIFTIAKAYFLRHNLIKGPHAETLKWWDDLNLKRQDIVPAIGGVDAHALKITKYILPVKIFPYLCCFETLTNVITLKTPMPEDFDEVKRIVLNSIKSGNNLIINKKYSKTPDYPLFQIVNEEQSVISGGEILLTENTYLHIKLPQNADIKVIKDGMPYFSDKSKKAALKLTKAGKYRFEAYLKNNPWIFSNPIKVK